jgi:hypothetical protein
MNCYVAVSWVLVMCCVWFSFALPENLPARLGRSSNSEAYNHSKATSSMLMTSTSTVRASRIQIIAGILDKTSEEVLP